MSDTITIEGRFCGPPGMGNGGYVCGTLAAYVDSPAEVTLRRPTPLDRPLAVVREAGLARLMDGDALLAEVRPAAAEPMAVQTASHAEAVTAAAVPVIPEHAHPLPHCFVCGPARRPGDGLRIYPGRLSAAAFTTLAAPWIPDHGLAGPDGLVAEPFIWAALDCPGGFAVMCDRSSGAVLLGRLAVIVARRPAPGEPCAVTAWRAGREGRKLHARSALFGADGATIAQSRATWILVDPAALHAGAG